VKNAERIRRKTRGYGGKPAAAEARLDPVNKGKKMHTEEGGLLSGRQKERKG